MAVGGDGSCKEAGLPGSDEIGMAKTFEVEGNTPKLHRNERKEPGLSTGVYENQFLAPAYKSNVRNGGFGSLAIPWGKVNAASLSLKRLEGFIENEHVEVKLIKKKGVRTRTPKSVTPRVPWLERKRPASASSRQRRTKYLALAFRD